MARPSCRGTSIPLACVCVCVCVHATEGDKIGQSNY